MRDWGQDVQYNVVIKNNKGKIKEFNFWFNYKSSASLIEQIHMHIDDNFDYFDTYKIIFIKEIE